MKRILNIPTTPAPDLGDKPTDADDAKARQIFEFVAQARDSLERGQAVLVAVEVAEPVVNMTMQILGVGGLGGGLVEITVRDVGDQS